MMNQTIAWTRSVIVIACLAVLAAAAYAAPDEEQDLTPPDTRTTAVASQIEPADTELEQTTTAVQPIDQPSLRGLSRDHWPIIVTGPESGRTRHNPTYYYDPNVADPQSTDPDLPKFQMRLASALDGSRAQNWNLVNGTGIVIQPLKVLFDTVMMVVSQPINPLWSIVHTPPMSDQPAPAE